MIGEQKVGPFSIESNLRLKRSQLVAAIKDYGIFDATVIEKFDKTREPQGTYKILATDPILIKNTKSVINLLYDLEKLTTNIFNTVKDRMQAESYVGAVGSTLKLIVMGIMEKDYLMQFTTDVDILLLHFNQLQSQLQKLPLAEKTLTPFLSQLQQVMKESISPAINSVRSMQTSPEMKVSKQLLQDFNKPPEFGPTTEPDTVNSIVNALTISKNKLDQIIKERMKLNPDKNGYYAADRKQQTTSYEQTFINTVNTINRFKITFEKINKLINYTKIAPFEVFAELGKGIKQLLDLDLTIIKDSGAESLRDTIKHMIETMKPVMIEMARQVDAVESELGVRADTLQNEYNKIYSKYAELANTLHITIDKKPPFWDELLSSRQAILTKKQQLIKNLEEAKQGIGNKRLNAESSIQELLLLKATLVKVDSPQFFIYLDSLNQYIEGRTGLKQLKEDILLLENRIFELSIADNKAEVTKQHVKLIELYKIREDLEKRLKTPHEFKEANFSYQRENPPDQKANIIAKSNVVNISPALNLFNQTKLLSSFDELISATNAEIQRIERRVVEARVEAGKSLNEVKNKVDEKNITEIKNNAEVKVNHLDMKQPQTDHRKSVEKKLENEKNPILVESSEALIQRLRSQRENSAFQIDTTNALSTLKSMDTGFKIIQSKMQEQLRQYLNDTEYKALQASKTPDGSFNVNNHDNLQIKSFKSVLNLVQHINNLISMFSSQLHILSIDMVGKVETGIKALTTLPGEINTQIKTINNSVVNMQYYLSQIKDLAKQLPVKEAQQIPILKVMQDWFATTFKTYNDVWQSIPGLGNFPQLNFMQSIQLAVDDLNGSFKLISTGLADLDAIASQRKATGYDSKTQPEKKVNDQVANSKLVKTQINKLANFRKLAVRIDDFIVEKWGDEKSKKELKQEKDKKVEKELQKDKKKQERKLSDPNPGRLTKLKEYFTDKRDQSSLNKTASSLTKLRIAKSKEIAKDNLAANNLRNLSKVLKLLQPILGNAVKSGAGSWGQLLFSGRKLYKLKEYLQNIVLDVKIIKESGATNNLNLDQSLPELQKFLKDTMLWTEQTEHALGVRKGMAAEGIQLMSETLENIAALLQIKLNSKYPYSDEKLLEYNNIRNVKIPNELNQLVSLKTRINNDVFKNNPIGNMSLKKLIELKRDLDGFSPKMNNLIQEIDNIINHKIGLNLLNDEIANQKKLLSLHEQFLRQSEDRISQLETKKELLEMHIANINKAMEEKDLNQFPIDTLHSLISHPTTKQLSSLHDKNPSLLNNLFNKFGEYNLEQVVNKDIATLKEFDNKLKQDQLNPIDIHKIKQLLQLSDNEIADLLKEKKCKKLDIMVSKHEQWKENFNLFRSDLINTDGELIQFYSSMLPFTVKQLSEFVEQNPNIVKVWLGAKHMDMAEELISVKKEIENEKNTSNRHIKEINDMHKRFNISNTLQSSLMEKLNSPIAEEDKFRFDSATQSIVINECYVSQASQLNDETYQQFLAAINEKEINLLKKDQFCAEQIVKLNIENPNKILEMYQKRYDDITHLCVKTEIEEKMPTQILSGSKILVNLGDQLKKITSNIKLAYENHLKLQNNLEQLQTKINSINPQQLITPDVKEILQNIKNEINTFIPEKSTAFVKILEQMITGKNNKFTPIDIESYQAAYKELSLAISEKRALLSTQYNQQLMPEFSGLDEKMKTSKLLTEIKQQNDTLKQKNLPWDKILTDLIENFTQQENLNTSTILGKPIDLKEDISTKQSTSMIIQMTMPGASVQQIETKRVRAKSQSIPAPESDTKLMPTTKRSSEPTFSPAGGVLNSASENKPQASGAADSSIKYKP